MLDRSRSDTNDELTLSQNSKVNELEPNLSKAGVKLQERQCPDDDIEMMQNVVPPAVQNIVVKIHEASADNIDKDLLNTDDESSAVSSSPPASNPSFQAAQVADTSPSFRSLHPGYVSNMADFWANIWTIENAERPGIERKFLQGKCLEDAPEEEKDEEINRLKETIMIQCQLFRATEEENVKLKEKIVNIELMNDKILKDLNHKSEKRENLVTTLRSQLRESRDEVSELVDKDVVRTSRILELEDKIAKTASEKDVLKLENLKSLKKVKELLSHVDVVEEKCSRLEEDLAKYEDIVNDLKQQAAPVENIKQKMASLDQDVSVLKKRLQKSLRRSKVSKAAFEDDVPESTVILKVDKIAKKNVGDEDSGIDSVSTERVLPTFCTSTKKRRMSPTEREVESPAKLIKMTGTTAIDAKNKTGNVRRVYDITDDVVVDPTEDKIEIKTSVTKPTVSVRRSFRKSRSKIGQQVQDCTHQ